MMNVVIVGQNGVGKSGEYLSSLSGDFSHVAAFTVKYITKRFIGEYDSSLGMMDFEFSE